MSNHQYDIKILLRADKSEPFTNWFLLFNKDVKKRIISRINRIRSGNFGDYKSLGDGVLELRLNFGSGYRIYFGR